MLRCSSGIIRTCLIVALVVGTSSVARDIKVHISGSTEKIESFQQGKTIYISFSELVEIVGGTLDWEVVGHQISYVSDTNHFSFMVNSPFFRLNKKLVNLTFPAVLKEGQLFLPAQTFLPFLDQILSQKIQFSARNRSIRIDSEYFNVTDLSVSRKANGLLIEVFLTSNLSYDVFVTEGNWLNISIRDGKLNRSQILSRRNSSLMYNLKAHQAAGSGQVSMRLKRKIETWNHKYQSDPPRIQISIIDSDFELDTSESPQPVGPDNTIDIVVIDAGHGGADYGAVGPGGTREKDIVLNIAKDLAKLIRKDKEFKVVMTRDRDETVSLQRRADIANEAKADLFISIHANASPKRSPRGWNVFFLAPARNDSARAAAQFENSFFLRDRTIGERPDGSTDGDSDAADIFAEDPVLSILNDMIMTEFQQESYDFALMADREMRRGLKIPARGVDQAGFFVLNMVFTPSVLIEAGFVSNKSEEKILKTRKFQKRVAQSLYNAIKRFKAKYEQ